MKKWHELSVSETAMEFGTDVRGGKREVSANRRSINNVFKVPVPVPASIIKELASDVSLLLLAVAYVIAAFSSNFYESITGIFFSLIVFIIGCYIKFRSSKRVCNSYRLLLPVAKITENTVPVRLSVFDLEKGDLIHFSKGDLIPADARIVYSSSLKVAERVINENTGKSEFVTFDKNTEPYLASDELRGGYPNMVYAGSVVLFGKGSAIVTDVGSDTKLAMSGGAVAVASKDDYPDFLTKFIKETKQVSLIISALLIPICLIGLYRQTQSELSADILGTFIVLAALASTCMSDLVTVPAEALVTKEILPSSRAGNASRTRKSRITKLSDTEKIANTDMVILLSADTLIDLDEKVRQVFFADSNFRFESLNSSVISEFAAILEPMFLTSSGLTRHEKKIRDYFRSFASNDDNLKRFSSMRDSLHKTRICVLTKDEYGCPESFIAQSDDIAFIRQCGAFRAERGSVSDIEEPFLQKAEDWYVESRKRGLTVYIFVSSSGENEVTVLEGMVAVGKEFPYSDADDDVYNRFKESGIKPVLIFENERDENKDTLLRYGIIESESEIVFASEYLKLGLDYSSVPLNASAYVGFGKKDTPLLINRILNGKNNLLYIVKDSANKSLIPPESVYAIHDTASHDTVKIGASLSLLPVDALNRSGGLSDSLDLIKRASMSYLKLGVFRNYLVFSLFMRVLCVCLPILFGDSRISMSSTMIIFSGFFCDYLALLAIMYSNGLPVRPKDTVADAKRLFSPSLYFLYAIAALASMTTSVIIANYLISSGKITSASAPWFFMYSFIAANIFSLGGLLLILMKKSRRFSLNYAYVAESIGVVAMIFGQYYLPDSLYRRLSFIGIYKVDLSNLPYIALVAFIAFITSYLINIFLSKIASWSR